MFSLLILIFHTVFTYAWECEVILDGPNVIKEGQTITLSASGTPAGGSYSWSNTPNLVPNGSTAQLTGYKPLSSEYIYVTITYTSPKGKKCHARKAIWVCVCYVKINGPEEFKIGDPPITLTAKGDPSDGTYEWSATPGLVPNGSIAEFTGQEPGDVAIEVTYTTPDGKVCTKTHTVAVKCSITINGPSEIKVGNTPITLTAEGNPPDGTYEWSATPGLVPNGSIAEFTGQEPGNVTIEVTYNPPDDGEPCYGTYTITVLNECAVSISGPSMIGIGNHITLTASGSPEGGTYFWKKLPGLFRGTTSARFTGQEPGDVAIVVFYKPPDGSCRESR